ncbi:Na/Pi symporter [Nisaea acidiphila]|uniref:Na/Pi symporter n=1 Tax=Nisaea acidiphila TaxID=1862145 RepID=A0A9J7APL0_9PROT|nr:Na/Pi symporter [Nisaea acidiphila]UUX49555.1 Na/Pi symporter [Nisaea acidiphila]
MLASAAVAIGGVGLFLIGMLILTDGLKSLIGDSQRRLLAAFTNSPVSGAATGALTTAVIQSSSATTVTAVGFVGAGLLSFPQALGIIFGANIGTTVTGWMVALIGFKLKLGAILLPVLLIAVLVKMFGRARTAQAGWALAGFCLIFIGLDTMQQGMQLFEGAVTPADFPSDTLLGRLQLVAIGAAITLVTQSSSAGVATAMVALGSGAITLPQAMAMVIGMDIATTFTAILATVGGSSAMRQTGAAHVVYNLLTGLMAFCLLTPFAAIAAHFADPAVVGSEQVALVAFHSAFNTLGVLLILPFTHRFARLILWLIPEDGADLARRLDRNLLPDTSAATDALAGTLGECSYRLFDLIEQAMTDPVRHRSESDLAEIGDAIGKAERYAEDIQPRLDPASDPGRFVAAMHALDHLRRLFHRVGRSGRIETIARDPALQQARRDFAAALKTFTDAQDPAAAEEIFDALRKSLREERRRLRDDAARAAAARELSLDDAIGRLDGIRWLHRCAYHVWRIASHMSGAVTTEGPPRIDSPAKDAALEAELD